MNRFLIFFTLLVLAGSIHAFVGEGESNVFEITQTGVEESIIPPSQQTGFTGPAWPNPFRGGAVVSIGLQVKAGELATCGIYNLAGQAVSIQSYAPGSHQLVWDGRDLRGDPCASGIYLLRLRSASHASSAKLVLIK
ncbi:MAG: T9SS type A sorting domain-containing protein [Candidatus Syntrophosphaera sp.]|nr:T9SS type A sorting domain-containing protein [Candidatus Syntrophosphaera sp.]